MFKSSIYISIYNKEGLLELLPMFLITLIHNGNGCDHNAVHFVNKLCEAV